MKLKISGDGTNVRKCLQLLNVTFSFSNDGPVAATEKGTYVLIIKDDYSGILEILQGLSHEMTNLS